MELKGIVLGEKDNLKKNHTLYNFTYITVLKWQFIEMDNRLVVDIGYKAGG